MATVGELNIHVTACGLKELSHLLAMLEANIAVLPGVVVKAMQEFADTATDEVPSAEQVFTIEYAAGVTAEDVSRAISAEHRRTTSPSRNHV